jgi:hypothetical protein
MFGSIAGLIDRWKRRFASRSFEVLADRDGVRVVLADGTVSSRFCWADVTEIRTFKLDLGTWDDIRLAFQVDDLWYEYSEEIKGFGQLSDTMREVFPDVPQDWFWVVMKPAFATNERVLYRRGENKNLAG